MSTQERTPIHCWGRFETVVDLPAAGGIDPLRGITVDAECISPSGKHHRVPGFWDGGTTWRVRFSPDETGEWHYEVRSRPVLSAALSLSKGVKGQGPRHVAADGAFPCVPYEGDNPLYRNGPPRVSNNRRHLAHADGTPFFWLADTVWNGPLLSTEDEWAHYTRTRRGQRFTAAQYVSTQWRTAPDGGPDGPTFTGRDRIDSLRPEFFRRLDARLDTLADAGIVGAPVLLWAIGGGQNAEANPGYARSEEDCALLACYQVARWHAHPVVWILNGDGRYTGEQAERWKRIGRAVFPEDQAHAPVATHPGGKQWVGTEFRDEPWLDIIGYQSGHGDDEAAWRWLVEGPPARQWTEVPHQAVINLEPCYENHLAYHSRQPHSPANVRRACYWSLLVSPTAGVTYGGHGVWGWDDGSGPPVAHPNTGTPLPWQEALHMPGAEQLHYLYDSFTSFAWWTLRPDQSLLREQPDARDVLRYVTAARSDDGSLAALYLPAGGTVTIDASHLSRPLRATWLNPRDGARASGPIVGERSASLDAPDTQDWLLVLESGGA
ncbi:MAG: DUF4038 domain-containing protein [Chloroflexi bacterium]|nr:DUF4038 domain-containing protein [Chloroflexota bacterium]